MSIRKRVRAVTNLEVLDAYIDRGHGSVKGTMLLPYRPEDEDGTAWIRSEKGTFAKGPTISEAEASAIVFQTKGMDREHGIVEVDERYFVMGAIHVASRHEIQIA
jgi:hypothetical protein